MSEASSARPAGVRSWRRHEASLPRALTEAVVDGEPIHWAAVERSARTPDERHRSRQLQLVAALAHGPRPDVATESRPGPAARGLVWVTSALVAAGLTAWLATGAPASSAGQVAVVMSTAVAALVVGACGRTRLAAATYPLLWLSAGLGARSLLGGEEPGGGTSWLATRLLDLPLAAAWPWVLWRTACATSGVARFGRLDRLCRSVMAAAVAWSVWLAVASMVDVMSSGGVPGWLRPVWVWRLQDASGPGPLALSAWAAAAAVALAVRLTHGGRPAHRRGAIAVATLAVLSAWLTAAVAPASAIGLLLSGAAVNVWAWPSIAATTPWLIVALLTGRDDVAAPRHGVTRLRTHLARALVVAAVAALVALGARLALLRQHALTDLSGDHAVRLAAAAAVLLLVLAAVRGRALGRLRHAGWRSAPEALIAELTLDLRYARTPLEVASRVTAHVGAAVDGAGVALLFPGASGWETLVGAPITLAHDSALATMLTGAGDAPLRLGPGASLRLLLPSADLGWLDRHGVHLLVPIAALDGPPRAALLLARASHGGAPGRAAVAFASVAAAMTSMALERCAALSNVTAPDDVGFECPACGRLDQSPGPCGCGAARCLSMLPTMLNGRYRLERRLGKGGMGVVYVATDVTLGRRVAIKTLRHTAAADAAALHVEAQAMAAIPRPGVAILYGLETWRGTPVLVMEYFARGTLAEAIARGPLPWPDALAIGTSLARTLVDLHRRQWVHRDLKPANIALDDHGRPVLLDFGLSRWLDGRAPRTAPHQFATPVEVTPPLAGTRAYLSPEALDGDDIGPHDDVWALAMVICDLLIGEPAASDPTAGRRDVGRRLDAAGVPRAIVDVLDRALHASRDHRIDRANELASELAAAMCLG